MMFIPSGVIWANRSMSSTNDRTNQTVTGGIKMSMDTAVKQIEIHGYCEPRFSSVMDAFAYNFINAGDVGASFTVIIDGKLVIDSLAGYADSACTRPWKRDTLACL